MSAKIKKFNKIKTEFGAIPHYGKKLVKGTAIGTGALVAAPIGAAVSVAKAGTVAAGTAVISAPTRAIQGGIKTPWQLGKLGYQKIKQSLARRKLAAAGMHNYENLKQRVSKRKNILNKLRTQKTKLNEAKFAQNLQGTGTRLSNWWKGKQITRKEKAITKAEERLKKSLDRKSERTQTTLASETANISAKAKKFLAGLNTTKIRQIKAYNTGLLQKRTEKAATIQHKITTLSAKNHTTRAAFSKAEGKKKTSENALATTKLTYASLINPKNFGADGTIIIDGIKYDRDGAIAKGKELRKQIKEQEKTMATNTLEFNKSKTAANALDAEVAKLTKQRDAYMAQGQTAEQLYGSFQRKKARVQQTKKNLGKTAQQLLGISTIKNVGSAFGTSLKQDAGLVQRAIKATTGKQIGQKINTSMTTLRKAVGKSLISSSQNISSRYTAIKEDVAPIGLKVKTLWRGYVNNFSKQGKLLKKLEDKVDENGTFASKVYEFRNAYAILAPGVLVPPNLREQHKALINQREIMIDFANLIAKNRGIAPDPNLQTFDAISNVGKGAKALSITLPIINNSELTSNIEKTAKAFNEAKDYSTKMQYKELYNHLKSIKRFYESENFQKRADSLVSKLNNLLTGLEVLPEFKTA